MNDEVRDDGFEHIADRPLQVIADRRRMQRGDRRAAAINAVALARSHSGRDQEAYSQSEADVIMAIMELLDRVAEYVP